ncbi:hypothetical protein ACFLQ8_02355 [Candidatus Auribacterota bacterium]
MHKKGALTVKLTKFEKLVITGCPWFFGLVLTLCGVIIQNVQKNPLPGLILACTGLICFCFYCVCYLMVRLFAGEQEN